MLGIAGCTSYVKTYDSDMKLLGVCESGFTLFGIPVGAFGYGGCHGSANPQEQGTNDSTSHPPFQSPRADKESLRRFFSGLERDTPVHLILKDGKDFQGTFIYFTAALWPSVDVIPANGPLSEKTFYLGDIWSAEISTHVPSVSTTKAKDGSLELAPPATK
jgi:hypothetical protein